MKAISIVFLVLVIISGGAAYIIALMIAGQIGGWRLIMTAIFPEISSFYWFVVFWSNGYPMALHNICFIISIISILLFAITSSKGEKNGFLD